MSSEVSSRFKGENKTLWSFAERVDVVCPKCGNAAIVDHQDKCYRIACTHCGFNKELSGRAHLSLEEPVKWLGYRLLLQTKYKGNCLWALNKEHLQYLHQYISAKQRPREQIVDGQPSIKQVLKPAWRGYHLTSRLPRWVVLKSSRPHVLRAIARLNSKLID